MDRKQKNLLIVMGMVVLLALVLVACQAKTPSGASVAVAQANNTATPTKAAGAAVGTATATPTKAAGAAGAATATPTKAAGAAGTVTATKSAGTAPTQAGAGTPVATQPVVIPNFDAWSKSGHNDASSPAFTDWNDTADKSVPATCARCHSSTGYQDYLGADGSKVGTVDKAAPIGTTVNCVTCHNAAASNLTSVTFNAMVGTGADAKPVVVSGLGPEARCMVCHQGRASKTQVDQQIANFKAGEAPDTVVTQTITGANGQPSRFGFINIHYYAAAATLYGAEVHGGYEYDGNSYDVKFQHVEGYNTCVGCHDPHTLQVKVNECATCHTGVKTVEDLKNIRMVSSIPDYNGNGNVKEGMFNEIKGLRDMLYFGMQSYAKDVIKTGLVYDENTYPYFFTDANNDNKADTDAAKNNAPIAYTTWTPRLLKAAYNYQVSLKDPGAFAHGNKYIVQLLYDSLADINTKLTTKVDMAKMHREDAGHFAGDTLPFRDWDAEGAVPGTCAKCHSATGLPQFIKEGSTISNPISNGLMCTTCHEQAGQPAVLKVADVTFPSGAKVTFGDGATANICIECHQGRDSGPSVAKAVAGMDPDTPSDKIRFRNIHYFAAGATLFGTEVKGVFEYPNQTYVGQFMHTNNLNKCTDCHEKHALNVKTDTCKTCHNTTDPATIRMNSKEDYNGNGDTKEGLKAEVAGYQKALYAAIQLYAKDVAKAGIVYDAAAYPYYFLDKNNDGKPDVDATKNNAPIAYNAWTPRLLEAAYNYQYSIKDPGSYAHNAKYVMQALYDSIADLKTKSPTIDNTKLIRPK